MLIKKFVYNLSLEVNFFFSSLNSLMFIKGLFGMLIVNMPSYFFYSLTFSSISFLFLKRFFFLSFLSHLIYLTKRLFFFNYVRLKIKGIGHRVRKITNYLYKFFFFSTSFFYFYVPQGLIFRLKKKRMLMVSNDLSVLKHVLGHILLLKQLTAYRKRGLLTFKQIVLKKEGKRRI